MIRGCFGVIFEERAGVAVSCESTGCVAGLFVMKVHCGVPSHGVTVIGTLQEYALVGWLPLSSAASPLLG